MTTKAERGVFPVERWQAHQAQEYRSRGVLQGRRRRGEGSISRPAADGRVEVAWTPPGGGRRLRRKVEPAEALAVLDGWKADHREGRLVEKHNVTVEQYLRQWLASGDWKPSTRRDYESIVERWLIPEFGRAKLQSLQPATVRFALKRWRDAGKGNRLRNVRVVLSSAMAQAVQDGLLAANPVKPVRGGGGSGAQKFEPKLWPPGSELKFLDATAGGSPMLSALYHLAITTGARAGELLGVTWADVDLDAPAIRIERSVTWIKNVEHPTPPKTRKGRRKIALPATPDVTGALRRWKAAQAEERLRLGPDWPGGDRVFTEPGGRPFTYHQFHDAFVLDVEAAGLPRIRLHDLRHLHASQLIAAGVPITAISRRLGHASVATTFNFYSHMLEGADEVAAADVSAMYAQAESSRERGDG